MSASLPGAGEHNGAGDATVVSLYDTYGRLVDTTDAGGITTTFEYDDPTGQVVATTIHGASGLTMASTNSQVNDMGRPVINKDSAGHVTTIYASSKMDSPKAAVTPSVGPSQVTSLTYSGGQGISTTSLRSPTVSNGGILASSQSIFDRGGRVKATTVSTPGGSFTLNGTSCTYDSAGRLHQLIAYNPKGSGLGVQAQVTSYSYDDPINGDLTTDVLYPADTSPVQFAYDRLGRKTDMTDQRGTHHRYEYDSAGRLDADRVLSFAGADDAVTAITCEYDAASRLKSVSSLDANANVMNQILYTYDDWGNVATEAQSHSGPADEDSPATQYVNDAQLPRLNELIYPGGLHVYYNYDVNSRGADIASSAQPGDAQKYVAYTYLGLGTIVKVTHPGVPGGLTLDYGQDGSAGLDRFGRVVYHAWTQQGTDGTANVIDGYAYGYDRASNRLYRRNLVNPAFSELYGAGGADPQTQYDGLDRLVGFQRGTLRADNRSVASADSTQSWQLDSLGNWSSTTTDGTTQARTHDEANEVTSIGGTSTTVDYDAAGNMTRIPVPGAETTAYYPGTYDAWNRLAGVFRDDGNTAGQLDSADTLVAAYRYDGLNRRIAKIIPLYADSQNPTTITGYDVSVRRSTPWVGDAIGTGIAWGA
jgi:YD repeat-containing protein